MNRSPRCNGRHYAMISAPAVLPAASALSGFLMCSASFVASAHTMRIELPKLPKLSVPNISLPKLPNLPGQGKTEAEAKKPKIAPPRSAPPASAGGQVKVRAASGSGGVSVPADAESAPSYADILGKASETVATGSAGYKRFPKKRMPGANLDNWKKIAAEIGPDN